MNFSFFLLLLTALLDPDKQKLIEMYEAQLDVLRSKVPGPLRFTNAQKARMALAAIALGRKALRKITTLVSPDTLFRWHREAVRSKWDHSQKRGPGRPQTKAEIENFIIQWAQKNKGWGYTRLRDTLKQNGFTVCRNTIKNILKKNGLNPAPERKKSMSWAEFTQTHWEALVGTDFFSWEVLTPFGLVTYYVLFFIHQKLEKSILPVLPRIPTCAGWSKSPRTSLCQNGAS